MNLEQGLWWERNIEKPGPGVAHDRGAKPAGVLIGALTGGWGRREDNP